MDKVVIIGGGASGIVAAIFAKREDNQVIVLERNSTCLKKLLMTGNGKCNYLNERYSINDYHSENIEIVDKIISDKNINLVKDFFDEIGIVPKIKNGYYYPFSGQATTIKGALLMETKVRGVEIVTDCLVNEITKADNGYIVETNTGVYKCKRLVLAMGGATYPKTGSDGMGYDFLRKLGYDLIKPLPALVQLTSNFKYLKDWNGIRTDVELQLFEDGKFVAKEEGEVQLTDYGISGICTFNLSHFVTRSLELGKSNVIKINFVPFIETLITPWMSTYSQKNSHKRIEELLEGFLNYKLVKVILKYNKIDPDRFYSELSKDEKFNLCKSLRAFPVEIIDTKSYDSAQVCNGGLRLTDINAQTMELVNHKGFYVVGELLDINGNCGGYNLIACWISGMLAGKSIGDISDKS